MGLTESNHSKAAAGSSGPSKSRSTPHFPDGRGYQNRPRQAATLPARPTPESAQSPPHHYSRTPIRDPHLIGHDPRPPEREKSGREGHNIQVGRSPSFHPLSSRRSASADSRKRRSDPLLDARTLKHLPEVVNIQHGSNETSSPSHNNISPPSTPRVNQRSRPTAIYVEDDLPTQIVSKRQGRSRDRNSISGKSHNSQKIEFHDKNNCSGEYKPVTHVSTLTMTPHNPDEDSHSTKKGHHKSKKARHKSGHRAEYRASNDLQGDSYVCLHYGGTIRDGQRNPVQQVTACRSSHMDEDHPDGNRQKSQVVIHMNQVCSTALDNYDAVNANIESVQVRRNVWFQASRNLGNTTNELPMTRKISSRAMRTPSIYENTSGYNKSEVVRWPDVTNKISSIYMRPDMSVTSVSSIKEEQEGNSDRYVTSAITCNSSNHRAMISNNHSSDHGVLMSDNHASSHAVLENKCIVKSLEPIQPIVACESRENEPKINHLVEMDSLENQSYAQEVDLDTPSYYRILPPLEFCGSNNVPESTNGDVKYPLDGNERYEETTNSIKINNSHEEILNNYVDRGMKINYGINNHVEDYIAFEDPSHDNHQFYGCRDNDYENDELSTLSHQSALSERKQPFSVISKNTTSECSYVDNPSLCDKNDKISTTDGSLKLEGSLLDVSEGSYSSLKNPLVKGEIQSECSVSDSENPSDGFYQKQLELVSEYLSLKDPVNPKDKEFNKLFSNVEKTPSTFTLPGNPSALAHNQKCLTHSTTLPRRLKQGNARSATDNSGDIENMKALRSKFRSLDMGHFPVLRLPIGNQPRLVDVLRSSVSDIPQRRGSDSFCDINGDESTISATLYDINSSTLYDNEGSSVSYSSFSLDDGTLKTPTNNDTSVYPESEATLSIVSLSSPEVPLLPYDNDSGSRVMEETESEGCDESTIKQDSLDLPSDRNSLDSVSNGVSLKESNKKDGRKFIASPSKTWQGTSTSNQCLYKQTNGLNGHLGIYSGAVTLRHPNKVKVQLRHDGNDAGNSSKMYAVSDPTLDPDMNSIPDIIPPYNRNIRRKHSNRKSLQDIDWDTPVPSSPTNANPDCNYTCHEQCQDLVTLDCKTDLTPDSATSEEELYTDPDEGGGGGRGGTLTLVNHQSLPQQLCTSPSSISNHISAALQNEQNHEKENYVEEEDDENNKRNSEDFDDNNQCQEEEKHEEELQEKHLLEEPFRRNEEFSTLRKSVHRLQSHLVDNDTLEAWVEKYNASSQGLQIAKEDDGVYRGCIRVHLNLSRPINIVAGTRPPSIYDILQEDRTMEKTLTSFYMPRDAVKAIHITSKTTTRDVIVALLRKFKVVDNPQKFALYERTYDTGQPGKAKLRRLGDSECPLVLAINWNAEGLANKRLVLQENDTADIQWEAFSLPELSNFLRILDREEEEYRCQIKDKYALIRRRIGNMLMDMSSESKETFT